MEIKLYAGKKEPTLEFRMQKEFLKECRWKHFLALYWKKKGNAGGIFCLLGGKKCRREKLQKKRIRFALFGT